MHALMQQSRAKMAQPPEVDQALLAQMLLGMAPGSGDVMAARDSQTAGQAMVERLRAGDYGGAAASGLESLGHAAGALPMVPAFGGVLKRASDVQISRETPTSYRITDEGEYIGEVNIAEGKPFVTSAILPDGYKRQGVGTRAYNQIESDLGRRLVPSPLGLTDDATAFWKKRLAKLSVAERQALLDESMEIGRGYGIKDHFLEDRLAPLRKIEGVE